MGALEIEMGRYGRRRDVCSRNAWPAGWQRAARVGAAVYRAAVYSTTVQWYNINNYNDDPDTN